MMMPFLSARLRSRSSNIPPLNVAEATKRRRFKLRDRGGSSHENMDISPSRDSENKPKKYTEQSYVGRTDIVDLTSRRRSSISNQKNNAVILKVTGKLKKPNKPGVVKDVLQKRDTPVKARRRSKYSLGDVFSSVPSTVCNEILPMDVDQPSVVIRDYMTRIPPGVNDIDADSSNIFNCPLYARDIYTYLQAVERRTTIPENYLEDSDVTVHARAVLVDWLIQVQVHLGISQQSLHFTVKIIDHYLSVQKVSLSTLQLVGISALLIATKYIERFPPEIDNLCHLTDYTYASKQVLSMEKIILKEMSFRLNIPDATAYMDRFIQVDGKTNSKEIEFMARYILDLSLTGVEFVPTPPSLVTAGAIFVSRMLFEVTEAWSCGLAYYTKYSDAEVRVISAEILKILSMAPAARHQGARGKYSSTSSFGAISKHPILQSTSLLSESRC